MSWTDERVESLKKLWQEGLSASQIAGRLGGVTRNAVIGKVHRLGLAGRATTTRMKSHRPRRIPVAPRPRPQGKVASRFNAPLSSPLRDLYRADGDGYVPPIEEVVIPLHERKSLNQLTESCCRWPIGDPQEADFHFCARKKVAGLPYCEVHARRAFQPPQARRRDSGGTARQLITVAPPVKADADAE
jgi:GcrA cell cycle regulator